jgi:hypothetical protein
MHIYNYTTNNTTIISLGTRILDPGGIFTIQNDWLLFGATAYQISTGTPYDLSQTPMLPDETAFTDVDGSDFKVLRRTDAGISEIYAVRLSTMERVNVTPLSATPKQIVGISGEYVIWRENKIASRPLQFFSNQDYDIYSYHIPTGTVEPMVEKTGDQTVTAMRNGIVTWADSIAGGSIYLEDLTLDEKTTIKPSLFDEIAASLSDYKLVIFGNDLPETMFGLALFDVADEAGINVLGIGADGGDWISLGTNFTLGERFAIMSSVDSFADAMEVKVAASAIGHPIFTDMDATTEFVFGPSNLSYDEQSFSIDSSDPNAPSDWRVLVTFGEAMPNPDSPAIVEFKTQNGNKVVLDGASNTFNDYSPWRSIRWQLFASEINYLIN